MIRRNPTPDFPRSIFEFTQRFSTVEACWERAYPVDSVTTISSVPVKEIGHDYKRRIPSFTERPPLHPRVAGRGGISWIKLVL